MMQAEVVADLLQDAVREGIFPGAAALGAVGDTVVLQAACGWANIFTRQPVTTQTLFDLASLTKPLATTVAVMHLCHQNRLTPATPLGELLPRFLTSDKADLTIGQLLNHQSGLAAYRPYYHRLRHLRPEDRRARLEDWLVAEPLCYRPGERTLYSDVGFMILAWVVEQCSGQTLAHYLRREIYGPLGLLQLFFPAFESGPEDRKFAASEYSAWRGRLIEGTVHDDNAEVVAGFQGHAGLFGNAAAVHHLLAALLAAYHGCADVFSPKVVRKFWALPLDGSRALGFDVPAARGSACGRRFSPHSIGHLGFTGTSFWVDIEQSITIVLLTNRVHPFAGNSRIHMFRPVFHDAVMDLLLKNTQPMQTQH
jgi:CubicO group peptidase (beta-lactamase class C family)